MQRFNNERITIPGGIIAPGYGIGHYAGHATGFPEVHGGRVMVHAAGTFCVSIEIPLLTGNAVAPTISGELVSQRRDA